MLYIGFDLAFIDTLVYAKDGQDLVSKLPRPGHHHRDTEIDRIAGGNGVNIAGVLTSLGVDHKLVIPSNSKFDELLNLKGLHCDISISADINETIAIIWEEGEIQFNQTGAKLNREKWTEQIHKAWQTSEIKVSTNWGLNPTSDEWISCQWLAACGWKWEEIQEIRNIFSVAVEEQSLRYPLVIEPGSIKTHHKKDKLHQLLATISKSIHDKKYPIFLANDEEEQEFLDYQFPTTIIHSANEVRYHGNINNKTKVPPISCSSPNFVGAGDAFLAGLLTNILYKDEVDIDFAIKVAQAHICGELDVISDNP